MSVLTNDVWDVSERDFPATSPIETQLGFLLRYAILAPSAKNSQPWCFAVRQNRIHLLADMRRRQLIQDPGERELYISLGCALENLLVAAEHFGFRHGVTYFPEPGTQELVQVRAGTVLVEAAGQAATRAAGDAVAFPGDVVHSYANPGDVEAAFSLAVFEPGVGPTPRTEAHGG